MTYFKEYYILYKDVIFYYRYMEITEILQKIGLKKDESAVYVALVEAAESATISEISRRAGIHRPLIYKALPSLQEKGLVSSISKGKLKRFMAESPQKLKIVFTQFAADFESALPELESAYQAKGRRPVVKFLEGKRGLQFVFEDLVTSLKRNDVYYRYTSNKDLVATEKYLPGNYRKIRDQKQLQRFIINNEAVHKQQKPDLNRATKAIPAKYGLFDYHIAQIIYGNKVAFVDYNSETALIIENSHIAEFQKKLFKLLYDTL